MKIITYDVGQGNRIVDAETRPSHGCVTYKTSSYVEVVFTINESRNNAAFVTMSPEEAEEMARILIVNAWRARFNK
jgi:hypothetical protein